MYITVFGVVLHESGLGFFLNHAFLQYSSIKWTKHEILGIFLPAHRCMSESFAFLELKIWVEWHKYSCSEPVRCSPERPADEPLRRSPDSSWHVTRILQVPTPIVGVTLAHETRVCTSIYKTISMVTVNRFDNGKFNDCWTYCWKIWNAWLYTICLTKMYSSSHMHAKPSFAHRLQIAKMASSRTSAQNNWPRAHNNGPWL